RRAGQRFPMKRFRELLETSEAVGVIVGLPLDQEGGEGESARAAKEVATEIARATGLPVELVDERFSTARALRSVREMGGSTRGLPFAALGAATLVVVAACQPPGPAGQTERFRIPPGASFSQVMDTLDAHGLLANRTLFRWRARLAGADRAVQAGTYEAVRGM